MTENRYFWYIPGDNTIIQEPGTFASTGYFTSRTEAIDFIKQTECSKSPEEVFLIEASVQTKEDAAVHVGQTWNVEEEAELENSESQPAQPDGTEETHSKAASASDGAKGHYDRRDMSPEENIAFLIKKARSDEIELPLNGLSTLQNRIENGNGPSDRTTAETICELFDRERDNWPEESRSAANELLASVADSHPDLLESFVDELVRDVGQALSKKISDHPGYGLVVIPPYGAPAAEALGHYSEWNSSAPDGLVRTIAEPERIKRAKFLISIIALEYPGIVDELYDYDADSEYVKKKYRLLGVLGAGEDDVANRAWDRLYNSLESDERREIQLALSGIKEASLSRTDRIEDPSIFFDIPLSGRGGSSMSRDISRILSHIVDHRPELTEELWEKLANEEEVDEKVQKTIANSLANPLEDISPYISPPEELVPIISSKPSEVAAPLSSLLTELYEDNPEDLEAVAPQLHEILRRNTNDKIQQRMLEALLPVAKESPNKIDSALIISQLEHENDRIRRLACEILGYSGPSDIYQKIKDMKMNDPSEKVQHASEHALTRLEARLDDFGDG